MDTEETRLQKEIDKLLEPFNERYKNGETIFASDVWGAIKNDLGLEDINVDFDLQKD